MSNLTDLIAEALGQHRAVRDTRGEVKSCTCGVVTWAIQKPDAPQFERHQAEQVAAVVADWLESDETRALAADAIFAEHEPAYHAQEARTKLRGVLERQFGETAATATAALAAEARKGAGQ